MRFRQWEVFDKNLFFSRLSIFILGGLAAVLYTDLVQTLVMLFGAVLLTGIGKAVVDVSQYYAIIALFIRLLLTLHSPQDYCNTV